MTLSTPSFLCSSHYHPSPRLSTKGHQGGWGWDGLGIGIEACTLLRVKWVTGERFTVQQRQEEKKEVRSVCRTYVKLTLKMHSNI